MLRPESNYSVSRHNGYGHLIWPAPTDQACANRKRYSKRGGFDRDLRDVSPSILESEDADLSTLKDIIKTSLPFIRILLGCSPAVYNIKLAACL